MTPITIEAMELMPKPKKRPRPIPHAMITNSVYVEMLTGSFHHWVVAEPFTIEDVKLLIFQEEGIPVQCQRLVLEAQNDRTISDPVKVNNEITFILMPVYYNWVVMNEEEGDENGERKEEKEQEDAKDKEEAKGEFSSQDWIGLELFGDEPDT